MAHTKTRSDTITIGPVLLTYPHLFETRRFNNDPNADPQYSTGLVIPPDQVSLVYQECLKLAQQAFSAGEFQQQGFDWPFRQISASNLPELQQSHPGWYTMNAKAGDDFPPQVVGHDRKPLMDRSQISTGAKAYVMLTFYSFHTGRNTGIGCGLQAVMVWGEKESITVGGSVDVAKGFEGVNVTPMAQGPGPMAAGMPPMGNVPGYPPGAPAQQPQGAPQYPPQPAPPGYPPAQQNPVPNLGGYQPPGVPAPGPGAALGQPPVPGQPPQYPQQGMPPGVPPMNWNQ